MNVFKSAKPSGLKNALKISLGGLLGAAALRLLSLTWSWTMDLEAFRSALLKGPQPRIFVFWHGAQLFLPGLFNEVGWRAATSRPIYVLISRHTDGRIIAKAISYYGIKSVAGSSSRGGASAARALMKKMEAGADIAITPDGPRGPREKAKTGVIDLAGMTGAFIYPISASATKFWQLKSWDKMIIPKPFARVRAEFATPYQVPENLSKEEVLFETERLGQTLKRLNERLAE